MTLIACPECDHEASDRAPACPHCGFPIAREIEEKLAQITGHDRIRTARQRAAAGKIRSWGEGYLESDNDVDERPKSFVERHQRALVVLAVAAMVTLQVYLLFGSIYD